MTDSETRAQKFLKEYYGKGVFIKKIPDFKQTGAVLGGLPDFLIIYKGETIWYEVKKISSNRNFLRIADFTNQQLVNFKKMIENGANIKILVYRCKGAQKLIIDYKDVYKSFIMKRNSLNFSILGVL